MKKQKAQSGKVDYRAYYRRLGEENEARLAALPVGYVWECSCGVHRLVKQSDGSWKDEGKSIQQS